uniref:Cytochrome c oxidase polypeptide II n=1 Tax=Ichthyophthirius multifiliis TaxID=5932 RepID=G1FLD8_ICHMU|nr:cytochrome c oxidase subunit 2 [Ichthyophthirius multifiliis]AEL89280.1 cytochrome c oxidase subunit 2 [Ichthyophthirius multifiliis]
MWSNILLETSYQFNFNIGFSTLKSDVIIHLAQWQYWWWFWFTLVWSLYYLIILKLIRYRSLKMRPQISTSFRPHGKWGDFIACIIPLTWCINILTNSNLILRLIEWQNESSLFTVRVRARQWYWIYKFELKSFTDILSTPKNIGSNKWRVDVFGDLQISDNYLHIIKLRSQNNWIKNYWEKSINISDKSNKPLITTPQDQFRYNINYMLQSSSINNNLDLNLFDNQMNNFKTSFILNNKILHTFKFNINTILNSNLNKVYETKQFNYLVNTKSILNYILNNKYFNYINHEDFDETNRFFRRSNFKLSPMRLLKKQFNIDNSYELFRFRFNNPNDFISKNNPDVVYLTLKQKRYNRKKLINSQVIKKKDNLGNNTKVIKYSGKPLLSRNGVFLQNNYDYSIIYKLLKKNKKRNELIPVTLARRLLRTKKTLVLPVHVNITLITNSYDIVHSWFIPGLGIKLDCVPGRSTHHTFFIDNVGFYYGQCAEICGRYHHHMPIRLCALPFQHFLLWWNNFGLPKMLNTFKKKKFESKFSFRKYSW